MTSGVLLNIIKTTICSKSERACNNLKNNIRFRFNPLGYGLAKFLGQREAEIMEIIWDLGPLTVAQVHDHLGKNGGLAYTTVMTIMGRLAKKGLLQRTNSGRAYIYSAKVSRDEFNDSVISTLMDGVLGSFARPALSYFVKKLSEEDASALDELEKVIQEKKAASEKG